MVAAATVWQPAEKVFRGFGPTSAAKATAAHKPVTAALEALRHPKAPPKSASKSATQKRIQKRHPKAHPKAPRKSAAKSE
jgi:hypothetical protein